MVAVRVVATVIAVVPAVAISADSVARWVLDVALVEPMALVDSAEIVIMDSVLQIAAGKQEVFMPFSIVIKCITMKFFAIGHEEAKTGKGRGKPRPYIYGMYPHFVYRGEGLPLILVQYIFL